MEWNVDTAIKCFTEFIDWIPRTIPQAQAIENSDATRIRGIRIETCSCEVLIDNHRVIICDDIGKQELDWHEFDLLCYQRPPIRQLHYAMYSKRVNMMEMQFTTDQTAWSCVRAPGCVLMAIVDTVMKTCSQRQRRRD